MVFRILPPLFRAKASAEGPCGKRVLRGILDHTDSLFVQTRKGLDLKTFPFGLHPFHQCLEPGLVSYVTQEGIILIKVREIDIATRYRVLQPIHGPMMMMITSGTLIPVQAASPSTGSATPIIPAPAAQYNAATRYTFRRCSSAWRSVSLDAT